ncbi:hypothetical protein COCNU_03G007330 [Cocos nucifera]|uniref:Uncharacterized protein n=1 Tax=Cocos nucifera TaxID=13894 RepID=A0A8K0I356_COCNU|nr:hypothetical protein COCNU_03G007330 [Cocos nucifera]
MPSHCLPSKLLTSAPSSSSSSSCSAFASDVLFSSSLVSQKAGLRLTPRLASACFFSRRLFWRKDGGTGGIVSLPEIKGAAVIDDFLMGPLGGFSVEQCDTVQMVIEAGMETLTKGRVESAVQKVSDEESEWYFHGCPHGRQLGAIVDSQSAVIAGRHVLLPSIQGFGREIL